MSSRFPSLHIESAEPLPILSASPYQYFGSLTAFVKTSLAVKANANVGDTDEVREDVVASAEPRSLKTVVGKSLESNSESGHVDYVP